MRDHRAAPLRSRRPRYTTFQARIYGRRIRIRHVLELPSQDDGAAGGPADLGACAVLDQEVQTSGAGHGHVAPEKHEACRAGAEKAKVCLIERVELESERHDAHTKIGGRLRSDAPL